jgi:two-component system nitrogen regulation sensor histidine kinase GlnL
VAEFGKQHENVLDLLETGVVWIGPDGRVDMMNSAAEQALMLSRDRALGRQLDALAVPAPVREAVLNSDVQDSSLCLREQRMDGGLFDCTVRKTRQDECLLEIHSLEWEQNRRRLQQREIQTGMLGLLSRNLGHEVRNPLGGIRGAAQMLADELESDELEMLARLIMRESDRIDELISRFGQPELQISHCDMYQLIQEALDVARAEFGENIEFERDYDPSIPPLNVDAGAIRQVVLNLLRNACQAGAGHIRIRTRVKHGSAFLRPGQTSAIRLDVDDDGSGVPESLRSLLFLPLVTGRRDGTGLGLSLSQQIASVHDGMLTFEPLLPGSRFSLFLPLGSGK